MVNTLICDLDGLLTDTEKLHFKSYQVILNQYDFKLNKHEYQSHWIRDGYTINDFVKKHNLDLDPAQLHQQKIKLYHKLVENEVELMPYAYEFIKKYHGKYKLAVATSSFRDNAVSALKILNVFNYFDLVVTRDDTTNLKPAPDIFIITAQRLKTDISDCVVLEDAQKGIEAAYQGGFKSIAIPNIYTKDNDFSHATLILSNLSEITPDILNNI